jgi:S-sulfo-L-cysteine synthase (O-acetyl-L-serine-dependent)
MHPPGHVFHGASGLLAQIGETPLVRLVRTVRRVVPDGVEIHLKLEGQNPGGSVKDRPALAMVLDAERRGVLRPGGTILDASSGNTGVALAMIAAARGYRLILCLPETANAERRRLLAAYGAEVVSTDGLEGSDGAIREARRLAAENPNWCYVDQYGNPANWRAHVESTGPEIWRDTAGRLTHLVATVGTSGTLMGCTRFLRSVAPDLVAIEVQPDSPFHGLEGLKHMATAIVPPIYDASVANVHLAAPTEPAFAWVRRLAHEEGLLVGPSGGAAVWAAVTTAQSLTSGVIVAIIPDAGDRYLSEERLWSE